MWINIKLSKTGKGRYCLLVQILLCSPSFQRDSSWEQSRSTIKESCRYRYGTEGSRERGSRRFGENIICYRYRLQRILFEQVLGAGVQAMVLSTSYYSKLLQGEPRLLMVTVRLLRQGTLVVPLGPRSMWSISPAVQSKGILRFSFSSATSESANYWAVVDTVPVKEPLSVRLLGCCPSQCGQPDVRYGGGGLSCWQSKLYWNYRDWYTKPWKIYSRENRETQQAADQP